ncbi:hypothetical protein [Streptomyces sp. NPDC008125]|uniref:WXG100-like domain-containing protein n=1 Tax=Streptomyces sp. NPDC008125 TaxID=3364811 RepID=UPI0036F07239
MSLEFPPDCAWLFAALTGEVPPNGDEDKLFALAEVHKDLHGKLNNDMKQQIAAALGYTSESFDGDAAAMYQAAMKSFIGEEGLNYFDAVADQAQLLATFTRKAATQLQYTKYMIIAQLVELLFEAIVAAALAFFFGASIQAYLAKCAIVRFLIRSWLGRALMTLLMHQLINVGMGVAMDLLVQWTQLNKGTRDEYEGDLTKGAALSGMIQGLLAGPFQFLGSKLGKRLADIFGKGGGKQLGKELDNAFPQPPVQGPKGPKGAGPKAPKTFGEDFAKNFANDLPPTVGPGGKAAGDKFVRNIGKTFSDHLGGPEAGAVGRDWARTLLENTGKKDLPKLLEDALKPLAKEGDGALGKILGQGAADQLGRSAIRAMAQSGVHGITEGVSEGAHAAVSEGFYNLFFSDDHTFSTSGLTFGSGMVEGRVGHILEGAGDKLGASLRNQTLEAGFRLPGAGPESSGGHTGPESGGGTGTAMAGGTDAPAGTSEEDTAPIPDRSTTLPLSSAIDDSALTDNSGSASRQSQDNESDTTGKGAKQPVVTASPTTPQGTNAQATAPPKTPAAPPAPVQANSGPKTTSSTQQNTTSGTSGPTTGPNTTSTEAVAAQEHAQPEKDPKQDQDQERHEEQEKPSPPTTQNSTPRTLSQPGVPDSAESRLADNTGAPAHPSSNAPGGPPHTAITIEPDNNTSTDTSTSTSTSTNTNIVSHAHEGASNSTPPPPPPPPPPPSNVWLSDEVRRFGTDASEGVSGVHLAPISDQVATALQQQALDTLEPANGRLTDAQRAEAREQLAGLLSPQALQDNRLMLLSKDGHPITLTVGGKPRSLAVQLRLENPKPSTLFGVGNRMPPHNNEQRHAAAFDSTSTASTTAVRTISPTPFSNTFSVLKGFLTGVPASLNFNITHQQKTLSTTVSSAVNSTSLLRSSEPASPFDYTALGRVREASPLPFQEISQNRADVRELGTVSAWFPEHLAVPGYDAAARKGFNHMEAAGFQEQLDDSPLWVMDSMADPGSLLREVRTRFGEQFGSLDAGSLATVEKFLGAEHLLGALPLQRATGRPGGSTGTWSPVLLDKSGNAIGLFKVTAEVTHRRGREILVGPKYSLERFLERQLKTDSLSKVSRGFDIEGGFGGVFNAMPEEADKAFRDFHLGGSVLPKGGHGRQKDQSLGAGATHGVTHNIRTNSGHVLTPANVVYRVEFIAADGKGTGPLSMSPTRVRLRMLTPQTVSGTVPTTATQKQAPPEVARLDAIGLTTTPLAVHGKGVTDVLEQARTWLLDNGYLPREGLQGSILTGEGLVKARLENLRKLSLLGSQHGLLGAMDELVDGGLVLHFNKPKFGGGVDRVRLRFTLDRAPGDTTVPTHRTSLDHVHLPSTSSLTVPGTSQESSGRAGTFQVAAQMTGFAAGHGRGAFTADYKGTWQTTDTSTTAAGVSHSQMIITTQQTTEVFRVPAVFAVEITDGSGPLPATTYTSATEPQSGPRPEPVTIDLAVPEKRTENFSQTYGEAVLQPQGTKLPPKAQTFLLPDSSLVDVVRGSKQLYEAVDAMLGDLSTPQAEQERTDDVELNELGNSGGPGHGPALPFFRTDVPVGGARADTSPASTWWGAATGAAMSVVDSVLSMATVVRQTMSTGDRTDQGMLLHEALHAQLTPAALMSRAHQMVKGVFVIDDLFAPGVWGGTDLVVEVKAVLTNPQDLGTVQQYGETDIGATDSASHQVTETSSHQGGPGFTAKYGQSLEEAEQAAAKPAATDPSAPGASKPVTGGAGVKGVYGRGNSSSVTTSASTSMTRVPTESGTHHRISADITYEVTVHRGHRRVSPLNRTADSVTRTVHVPGGITFLATADQLRRGGPKLAPIAGEETGAPRPDTARLPYRFVEHGALGLAAVLEATLLSKPHPHPAQADENTSQEQSSAEQTAEEPEPFDGDPRQPHLLREKLTDLVRKHAPGSLTPGHRNYVPGLAQRIADYTSPAALGALPGRGADGALSFSFPYTGGPITRTVTVRVHGRPAWTKEQLRLVTGRSGDAGAGVENFSAHAPANVTESRVRTTRVGFTVPGSIVLPTSVETSRKAILSPSAGGSTTRSDTVSRTLTAEDRLWQRVEGGNEFTLAYTFTADLHVEGNDPAKRPSEEVDGRVTLRFSGDTSREQAPKKPTGKVPQEVGTKDPRLSGPLATAKPLRPTGHEVAYALSNQQDLLNAVQELAPELAGKGTGSGSSSEAAAVRLTELLHGGSITMDPVREAAGAGGTVTGTAKHPRVTLSTQVFRPRVIDTTRNVTVDRVRVTGFSASAGSSTSRSSAFTLGVSGTLTADGGFEAGGSVPLLSYQSVPGGQGGGVSALARHWEKSGTAGMPGADQGLVTHEVEVDTVTTLTGPDGKVRYATGTALLRVPERDLLGLGVLPEAHRGEGVWDLSAPDVRGRTASQVAQLITASDDVLPQGAVVQLWLDLGTNPTPDERFVALHRAQSIAKESGQTLELALRDGDGTRVWTLAPDSDVFPDRDGAREQLRYAREQLEIFEQEHGRPPAPVQNPWEALRQATELRTAADLAVQRARRAHAEQVALVAGFDRTETEARDALRKATRLLESTSKRLAAAAPDRVGTLTTHRTTLLEAVARLERTVAAYDDLGVTGESRHTAETLLDETLLTERAAQLELQWHGLTRSVERANARLVEIGVEQLTLAAAIARAHRAGGTEVPGLPVPPLSDPATQSLASLTPRWPSPRTPDDSAAPAPTGTGGSREVGRRTENPVLPHEVAALPETKTAAVNTERFDPKLEQTRSREGLLDGSLTLIRNHVRRIRMRDGRTVRQFYVALPVRLTDGLSAQDLAALQTRLQSTLDAHVNTGYVLPESGDQLHVTVELVQAPEHGEAVTLSQSDGPPVRADQRRWDVGHGDAVLTHEILHYLGLADEYSDAREQREDRHLFRRDDRASGVRREGLMVNTLQESLENLPSDYLATIERVSENAVVPLSLVLSGDDDEPAFHESGRHPDDNPGDASQQSVSHSPQQDDGRTYLKQPHYASGDQFAIAAALMADEKLSVVITFEEEQSASTDTGTSGSSRRKAETIRKFYLESGIPADRIQVMPAADSKAFFKAFVDDLKLSSKERGNRVLGVGDATRIVGKQFSTELRETVKQSWNLDQEQDTAVESWLATKGVTLDGTDRVAVLWSRFSGKKGEVHIEHDTGYIGIAEIIAGLGDVKAVLIVGDSGAEPGRGEKLSPGKEKFRSMAAYFNEGELPGSDERVRHDAFNARVVDLTEFWNDPGAAAWGGTTRTGQFRLFDYLDRHSTARHLGFRSGNLEAMALMGFPVRYLEEPNSEMGGDRMTVWHTAGTGPDGSGRTVLGGLAPNYERLMVSRPPTRSGQHQKTLDLSVRAKQEKHARWHVEDKLAKHLTTSRPKGFTDEDLANFDAFLKTGDPGDGIPTGLREQVRDIGQRAHTEHIAVEGLKQDIAKAARAKGAQSPQGQQRKAALEERLRTAQEELDTVLAEFSALFGPETGHERHDILRARNAETQSVAHLLTESLPSTTGTGRQGAARGPESRLAPESTVGRPSSQSPPDRPRGAANGSRGGRGGRGRGGANNATPHPVPTPRPPLVPEVRYRNASFTALTRGTAGRGTLTPGSYRAHVAASVGQGRPASYVVNAIVDGQTFAQEGRLQSFVDSVLRGLSPEMRRRTVIVIGVNGRVTSPHELSRLHDAIAAGSQNIDSPVPLAVVAVPMRWNSRAFPFGEARNTTLTSDATRQALHGLVARNSHPYLSFMDFDEYPHTVPSGPHIFDHFARELAFPPHATTGSTGSIPPLRPLLMSGGYRIPVRTDAAGRAQLVRETRERWQRYNAENPNRSLGEPPADLAEMVEEFDREIREDMRARARMSGQAPFQAYSPEPNLFVDGLATLLEGAGPTPPPVRFSTGSAEFNGLALSLMHLAAWEIVQDHGTDPDGSLRTAAEMLRPAVRGTAFVIDFENAATQTDLSRLYFGMLQSRRTSAPQPSPHLTESQISRHRLRVPQSHLNPVPYGKLFQEPEPSAEKPLSKSATYQALADLRESGVPLTNPPRPSSSEDVNRTPTILDDLARRNLLERLSTPLPSPGGLWAGLQPGALNAYTYAMNLLYGTDAGVLQRSFHEIASTYLAPTGDLTLTTRPGSFFAALAQALDPGARTAARQDPLSSAFPVPLDDTVRQMLVSLQQEYATTPSAQRLLADAARQGLTVEDLTTRLFTGRVHPMGHVLDEYIGGRAESGAGLSTPTAVTFTIDDSARFLLGLYASSLGRGLQVTGPDGRIHTLGPATDLAPLRVSWRAGEGWSADTEDSGGSGASGPGDSGTPGDKGKKVERGPRPPWAPAGNTAPPATSPRRRAELVENPVPPGDRTAFQGAATAAVRTERFDPKLLQLDRRPGILDGSDTLIRYRVRREQTADGRIVRHFVVALPFRLAEGLTPADLSLHQALVQETLDTHVNRGYRLPESGDQLRVTVEFSHAPTHDEAVALSNDSVPGRADQSHWDINDDEAVIVHELLHYLGLADEYSEASEKDPHLFRRTDDAGGVRGEGLMAHTRQESLEHLPYDYLATIERVSDNAVVPLHTTPAAQTATEPEPGPESSKKTTAEHPEHGPTHSALSDLALHILTGGSTTGPAGPA